MTRLRIDPRHLDDIQLSMALLFPSAAGLVLFGWRCVGVWALILLGALATRAVLFRLRNWTATPRVLPLLTQSILVGLFVPATLFDLDQTLVQSDARWPLLLASGALLCLLNWAFHWLLRRRAHAVVWTSVALTLGAAWLIQTDRVLRPHNVVAGDVLDARAEYRSNATAEAWMDVPRGPDPVLLTEPATVQLQEFLRGRPPAGRENQTVARLLSDDLPPLEDLVVGGHPAAIGRGSVIALLIGGLFLVYRGLTPLRVPAVGLLFAYLTLILIPLPAGVGGSGARRWLFEHDPRVGWAAGLTLVNYLFVTSAIPIVATFLLPLPGVRPAGRWAAAGFAILFGICSAVLTVFVSISGGAILALALMQLVWPRRKPAGA